MQKESQIRSLVPIGAVLMLLILAISFSSSSATSRKSRSIAGKSCDDTCFNNIFRRIYANLLAHASPTDLNHLEYLNVPLASKEYASTLNYIDTGVGCKNSLMVRFVRQFIRNFGANPSKKPSRQPLKDSSKTVGGCIDREDERNSVYIELAHKPDDVTNFMSNEDTQSKHVKFAFACNPRVSDLLRRKATRHDFTLYSHCAATHDGHLTLPVTHDDVTKDVAVPILHFSDWLRNTVSPKDRVLLRSKFNPTLLRHLAMEGTLCLVDELNIVDSGNHDPEFCQAVKMISWLNQDGCNIKLVGATC